MNNKINVKKMALVGVMAALVFTGSWLQIDLAGITRFHLGNAMCLMAGLILGPVPGGLAAGIGSMLFDFTNPAYISAAPFTFVFKFVMGYVCGKIAWGKDRKARNVKVNILAGVMGILAYMVLYISKGVIVDTFFKSLDSTTVMLTATKRLFASTVNGILAVAISVPLTVVTKKALRKSGLD